MGTEKLLFYHCSIWRPERAPKNQNRKLNEKKSSGYRWRGIDLFYIFGYTLITFEAKNWKNSDLAEKTILFGISTIIAQ